jgi:predicted amidohydrolase
VFLASANKIGLLTSPEQTERYSTQQSIPQEYMRAIGNSQIVSPSGKVLAKLDHNEEGYVFADIDLKQETQNLRPDCTEIIKQLRPELYQESTLLTKQPLSNISEVNVPATVNTAIFATYTTNEQAIEDVCHYIENNLSDIIQLPELFFVADKELTHNPDDLALMSSLSQQLITKISSALRPFQYVCTSLVIEGQHQAVIINEHGIFATQPQLHFCERYKWTPLGDGLTIVELPLEQGSINVAMLTADDATIPEMVKLAALRNIHVLLVPFDIQEPADVELSLLSRAAENRICIVAASREKSFADTAPTNQSDTAKKNPYGKNKIKRQKSTGFIANLATPEAQLAHRKSRKFNNYINQPLVKHQHGKITKSLIFPIAACTKRVPNEL